MAKRKAMTESRAALEAIDFDALRKKSAAELEREADDDQGDDLEPDPEDLEEDPAPAPRRRGRPRKTSIEAEAEELAAEDPEAPPRRGPGRPRKETFAETEELRRRGAPPRRGPQGAPRRGQVDEMLDQLIPSNGNGTKAPAGRGRKAAKSHIQIPPINNRVAVLELIGTSPYVQNKFSEKAQQMMREKQQTGTKAKKDAKKREAKDFEACYRNAMHVFPDGSHGIPSGGFQWALVTACTTVGFHMTDAKKALDVLSDGVSADGTPLVKITKGKPHKVEHFVRNETGVADIRARPMFDKGWRATIRVQYDADVFDSADIANLVHRAGLQIGIGEGRKFSKKSCGMGWGCFKPVGKVSIELPREDL